MNLQTLGGPGAGVVVFPSQSQATVADDREPSRRNGQEKQK
jgi:hypothetical protein